MHRISLQENVRDLSEQYAANAQRRRRMQGEEARYTLVLHAARKTLHITINEYCLADTVHKLSSGHGVVPGWCYASKEHLGKSLGFSRQSIHSMINKLRKKGLVEVQEETGCLRSTDLWRDTVEILKTKVFGQ